MHASRPNAAAFHQPCQSQGLCKLALLPASLCSYCRSLYWQCWPSCVNLEPGPPLWYALPVQLSQGQGDVLAASAASPGLVPQDDWNSLLWNVVMLAMGGLALGEAVTSSGLLLEITRHLQALVGPGCSVICLPGSVLGVRLGVRVCNEVACMAEGGQAGCARL